MPRFLSALLLLSAALLSSGCDLLGIESTTQLAERRSAEGKAVGGACRHVGRPIEECYALNKRAEKAAVFAGWREMNDYMRENKIETAKPAAAAASAPAEDDSKVADAKRKPP